MHPFSGGTSLCRPLEGVYSPRGSTRAHGCLYLTMSWSFQHFLSFHITFYQTSHWTSFSFKTFVSDESIHGKPDTLDTFALWNPRQSCILDSIPCIPDSRYCSSDSNPALYVFRNPRLHSRISWIPESVHKRKFPRVRNPDSPTWGEYFPWAAGRVINAKRFTSGEPDSKQVAVISKENSRFRFRFQNKRTPFHIMFRLYKSLR